MATIVMAGVALFAPAAVAATNVRDYAQTALNIIPSGQYGGLGNPPGSATQALMYDALTPLFDHVTNAALFRDFKSERFGVPPDGPGTAEPVAYPGVTLVRDRFDVPHVTAITHNGGVWAAGWIAAEDRGLLLQQARYNARVAAIDVPGVTAIDLVTKLKSFTPSAQTERVVSRQTQVLLRAGPEGRHVLHDIDVFTSGINAYLKLHSPSTPPWTRNDVYAINALKDQYLGEGGGNEARNAEFLGGLERRLGTRKGYGVFNDLRQNLNAGSPTTVDGRFNYEHAPARPGAPGSIVLNPGSFKPTPAVPSAVAAAPGEFSHRTQASNELMIDPSTRAPGVRCWSAARRSATSIRASRTRSTCTRPDSTGAARHPSRSRGTC